MRAVECEPALPGDDLLKQSQECFDVIFHCQFCEQVLSIWVWDGYCSCWSSLLEEQELLCGHIDALCHLLGEL